MIFYAVEVDAYRPGGVATTPLADAYGTTPWGALTQFAAPVESFDTLRASDLGYRTRTTDAGGLVVYPPYLGAAFAIDIRLNLLPGQPAAAAGWGSVTLTNAQGRYDAIAGTSNSDGRGVRVKSGVKTYDSVRGLYIDPPLASLSTLFVGLGQPWFLSETELDVPLRDATYWLERPAQSALYGGTGGLDGSVEMKGLSKPKTRGVVRQIAPVLVDAVNRVYQWTDNAGTITALYEGGATGITFSADVADLYVGSTPAGQYRTNKARGLLQLGSAPVRLITLDATGDFITPAAGSVSTPISLARWFMIDDMALPAALLDVANLAVADSAYPYSAGFYLGTEPTDGVTVVGELVGSIAAKLVPSRSGALKVFVLRSISSSSVPAAVFSRANAVSLVPRALGEPLDPPPYRWQVAYGHSWTVQTSDLSGSITAANKQFIAVSDRYSVWVGTSVLAAYRRPSDPAQVPTYLVNAADALAVATALGALWGVRRRQYELVVPVALGVTREVGDVVGLTWPFDDLGGGRVGQVVGLGFRAGESTITLTVLV